MPPGPGGHASAALKYKSDAAVLSVVRPGPPLSRPSFTAWTPCFTPHGFAGLAGLLMSHAGLFKPPATRFRPPWIWVRPLLTEARPCLTPQGFAGLVGLVGSHPGLLKPKAICCRPW